MLQKLVVFLAVTFVVPGKYRVNSIYCTVIEPQFMKVTRDILGSISVDKVPEEI